MADLHLVLPSDASGEANVVIQLVATDGASIADAATVLKMPANSAADIPASNIETELAEAQVSDKRAQAVGEKGVEKTLANLDAAMATPGDPVPLPTGRPAQTSNNDANWITLTSVNLRERPTRVLVRERYDGAHLLNRPACSGLGECLLMAHSGRATRADECPL
jgi:hypothetical protein